LLSVIHALPFSGVAPPCLSSGLLDALGELAQAASVALQPWIKELVASTCLGDNARSE